MMVVLVLLLTSNANSRRCEEHVLYRDDKSLLTNNNLPGGILASFGSLDESPLPLST